MNYRSWIGAVAIVGTLSAVGMAGTPTCDEKASDDDVRSAAVRLDTVKGAVIHIDRMEQMHGVCNGVHLTLKIGERAVRIHLAPGAFMKANGITIAKNDALEVSGFYIDVCGNPELMASTITVNRRTLRLRDASGHPLWNAPKTRKRT